MPSQFDFDKVNTTVIQPIKRLFDAKFDEKTIDLFVYDLCQYNEETLEKAMKVVRRECKRKPTLAHVLDACEKVACSKHVGTIKPPPDDRKGSAMQADSVMRTWIGQIALGEGWANSLWVHVVQTGQTEYSQADVAKHRSSYVAAKEVAEKEIAKMNAATDDTQSQGFNRLIEGGIKLAKTHVSLWRTMQDRNDELCKKYWRTIEGTA